MTETFFRARAFFETALRVWSERGVDPVHGDFVEALTPEGEPVFDLPRRGRTQARQILVFAMAHALGDDPGGRYLQIAERGYEALNRRYRHAEGGLMFAVSPDGVPLDEHCFAYELAFLLMAQGWLFRASGRAVYAQEAEAVWSWLECRLYNAVHDGFDVGLPGDRNDPRQQNPHMHLFEACILNVVNIGGLKWRMRMEWLYALFDRHFFDSAGSFLREFFQPDWRPHRRDGDRLDPGHHFEWTWLLSVYARIVGRTSPRMEALYVYGLRHGTAANGLGWDEIYADGRELRRTSRLWVQCELLKAHIAMFDFRGDAAYREKARQTYETMERCFLRAKSGCWIDQLTPDLEPLSSCSPASTLYHLYVAFTEYRRVFGSSQNPAAV